MSAFRPLIIAAAGIVIGSAATPSFADLSGADRNFATQTAQDNMSEIQDAQLAETFQAPTPVKLLAQRISKDRAEAQKDLKTVAQQENFSLPSHVNEDQQQDRAKLGNVAAPTPSHPQNDQRDQAYVGYEVGRLQKEVNLFEVEMSTGANDAMKSYAQKYLPIIQEELKAAQSANPSG